MIDFGNLLFKKKGVDIYHEDIFPPAPSGKPALSSEEWFAGHTKPPLLIDLRPEGYKSIYEIDPMKKGTFFDSRSIL
jgi:coronin-1B/1C/6